MKEIFMEQNQRKWPTAVTTTLVLQEGDNRFALWQHKYPKQSDESHLSIVHLSGIE
jgi:hypothetical protein